MALTHKQQELVQKFETMKAADGFDKDLGINGKLLRKALDENLTAAQMRSASIEENNPALIAELLKIFKE